MRFVVTGGAGFIGSHLARTALLEGWASEVVVLDALTYAGNYDNLRPVHGHPGFTFVHGDITDKDAVSTALQQDTDALFHFAAESHVDRSILGAAKFVQTNVVGTQVLLDAARKHDVGRFVHVSTDEVYGSLTLESEALFVESTQLAPTSPYSASKAGSDMMVQAAVRTHGLDAVITRCSNNYGPYQFPEKFLPLLITNALDGRALPLYGDGRNVRDWIHVDNHVRGIHQAFSRGTPGAVYNLGGECERANIDLAHAIIEMVGCSRDLLRPVADRLAHDRRYAIDATLAKKELKFVPGPSIETRLESLVKWYVDNRSWWESIKAGAYRSYYEKMYGEQASLRDARQHSLGDAPSAGHA
jgi:dTDP-glucose 4,6-dehydratase